MRNALKGLAVALSLMFATASVPAMARPGYGGYHGGYSHGYSRSYGGYRGGYGRGIGPGVALGVLGLGIAGAGAYGAYGYYNRPTCPYPTVLVEDYNGDRFCQ
jgi:hypothetical protein